MNLGNILIGVFKRRFHKDFRLGWGDGDPVTESTF